jgi:hypothetical protein
MNGIMFGGCLAGFVIVSLRFAGVGNPDELTPDGWALCIFFGPAMGYWLQQMLRSAFKEK